MIRMAESEIALAVYDIDDSSVPSALLSLLCERAREGIKVRIVIDGFLSRIPIRTQRCLADAGVEIKVFHPLFKGGPGTLNHRMHSKLMVVDRKMMIIGSRNLTDKHFGLTKSNYVNCDSIISGGPCSEAACYFDEIWSSDKVSVIQTHWPYRNTPAGENASDVEPCQPLAAEQLLSKLGSQMGSTVDFISHGNSCTFCPQETSLLYDRKLDKSDGAMAAKIISMVDSAKNTIVIESPYPAFSNKFVDALDRATHRGVSVALLTNSLCTTDQVIAYAAYQNQKRSLLKRGIRLLEYTGPGHLHAKGMVIDQQVAVLGSYNFDARAEGLNLEICVITSSPNAVAIISQSMIHRHHESMMVENQWKIDVKGGSGLKLQAQLRAYQLLAPLLRPSL